MRSHLVLLFISFVICITASGQPKTRGKVKRKYRDVEQVNKNLPDVFFHGRVRDIDRDPIEGASVEIEGFKRRVHTNEDGRFLLTNIPTGRLRIKISHIGYRTKTIDYYLQVGQNDHYLALDQDDIHLEPVTVTSQNREQQIPDIPFAISSVSDVFAEQLNITDMAGMAEFIPGLFFEDLGGGNSGFSIRGSAGSTGFPGLTPAVAVFSDQVPVEQPYGFSSVLFDIDRVEVLKGTQNSLFGRDAFSGSVNIISKDPEYSLGGYITAGGGNFGRKEIRGAINIPVAEDILYIRAAGIYNYRNGYIENTFGGTLNGDNTMGGRLSFRLLPSYNQKVDFKLNYQKKRDPGVALINGWVPNEKEETGLFSYRASLNTGEGGETGQELIDATLTYRIFRNEHTYWTSVTSYRRSKNYSLWDVDGTPLPAIGMNEDADMKQFFQEIRYNFSRKSRLNGSMGLSYTRKNENKMQVFSSDDQMIFDLLNAPGSFIMPAESRFPVNPQPLDPAPMAGLSLPGSHNEEIFIKSFRWDAQAFMNFTYQFLKRWYVNGGARVIYDNPRLTFETVFAEGASSVLGQYTGTSPNLLYKTTNPQALKKGNLYLSGHAGIIYRWNEDFNIFFKGSRGFRPQVIQLRWDGNLQLLDPEIANSLEAGWKLSAFRRIFFDATGFYRRHVNVLTTAWGTTQTGRLSSGAKALSYGAEAGVRVALIRGVDIFGNYAWMVSSFDSTDVNRMDYIYAGNSFAFAPEHSYSAGVNIRADILPVMQFFFIPWYSWKSHFWFTEANVAGIDQLSYGLLNINTGLDLTKPNVIFSIYGTNLLEENYIISAGHWGGLFGLPTFIPGSQRMLGARLTWKF